ncbi:hypothetical protein C5O23_04875 [Duncaniella muris]|uniref:Uncharacterized protein n=1 Tax=Duncaniella muris TaxID=2094150 RepID=A0A2V1IQR5_9BACT|nr:hypothetical protein C5O23_04875 [Duncaniella muris]
MVTQATEDGGKAGDGRSHRQRRTAARRGTDGQRAAGVRQDTGLLVAPDTAALCAQVSGGYIQTNVVSGRTPIYRSEWTRR